MSPDEAGTLVQRLDARWYPGVERNWDDRLFRERILNHIGPDSCVLDLGAGAGIVTQMNFRADCRRVCGVDLDERVLDNPWLHDAKVGSAEAIPYPDAEFDVVFADNVLEHLPDPAQAFREIARVLKPGGVFLGKTPNKWHYMPVIARLTPLAFHRYYNRIRGRAGEDTFPTRYLANSPSDLAALERSAGLRRVSLERIEGRPEYLRIHPVTYAIGHAFERIVNSTPLLSALRVLIVVVMQKPG